MARLHCLESSHPSDGLGVQFPHPPPDFFCMSKEASLRWYNKNKDKLAKRRKQRASNGLCKYCGKRKLVSGRSGCKKCLASYAASRKIRWQKHSKNKLELKLQLIDIAGGRCVDCGFNKHHTALEFDHVRGEKLDAISNMLNHMIAFETILKEVEKCELVCANCHAIRTYERLQRRKK